MHIPANPATSNKIARHEDKREFLGVLVLAVPHRVVLLVKLVPKVGQRHALAVVV